MDVQQIKNDAGRHVALCMCVYVAIVCVARCAMQLMHAEYGLKAGLPLILAFLYAVVETVVVVMAWLRTALANPERMPAFNTASTALRMLSALAVLFVEYLVVGRDGMLPYFAWMVLYYFAALILHCVFFSREMKKLYGGDENGRGRGKK